MVIDDESDYFSHDSNKWLSASEKAAVRAKEQAMRGRKEAAKRSNMIKIDLLGRTVTEYDAMADVPDM